MLTTRSRSASPPTGPDGAAPGSEMAGSRSTPNVLRRSANARVLTPRMLRSAAAALSGSSGSASRPTTLWIEMADTECASTSCTSRAMRSRSCSTCSAGVPLVGPAGLFGLQPRLLPNSRTGTGRCPRGRSPRPAGPGFALPRSRAAGPTGSSVSRYSGRDDQHGTGRQDGQPQPALLGGGVDGAGDRHRDAHRGVPDRVVGEQQRPWWRSARPRASAAAGTSTRRARWRRSRQGHRVPPPPARPWRRSRSRSPPRRPGPAPRRSAPAAPRAGVSGKGPDSPLHRMAADVVAGDVLGLGHAVSIGSRPAQDIRRRAYPPARAIRRTP